MSDISDDIQAQPPEETAPDPKPEPLNDAPFEVRAASDTAEDHFVVQAGDDTPAQVLPQRPYLDRTTPDRERLLQRLRPQLTTDHIKEFIRRGGNILNSLAVFLMVRTFAVEDGNLVPGTWPHTPQASLPIGVGEPRWKPGRDRFGKGGGGPDASNNIEDIIWLDVPWSELVEMIGLLFKLPFLLAKNKDKLTSVSLKMRGLSKSGPQARKDDEATFIARLERWRATYSARPEDFPGLEFDDIPTVEQFPYEAMDDRFRRVEESADSDSKAVMFLLLDTSGSMWGEAIAIARFYFLLTLMWLRSMYEEVDLVFIPHGGWAQRVDTEEELFSIDANGGTDFTPAYELALEIRLREYPATEYNAYLEHATDGVEDSPPRIAVALENLVNPNVGDFSFVGLCIVDIWNMMRKTQLEQAYDLLSEATKAHVGIGRARNQDEVPAVMEQIMTKDGALVAA